MAIFPLAINSVNETRLPFAQRDHLMTSWFANKPNDPNDH